MYYCDKAALDCRYFQTSSCKPKEICCNEESAGVPLRQSCVELLLFSPWIQFSAGECDVHTAGNLKCVNVVVM